MTKLMKVGKKYQVVIPKEIREVVNIKPDDEVIISVYNGRVILQPKAKKFSEYMRGLGKELWEGGGEICPRKESHGPDREKM